MANDPRDDLARLSPFLPDINEAVLAFEHPPHVFRIDVPILAAIALRETLATWGPGYSPKGDPDGRGDSGHGCGIFQIDNRGPYRHLIPHDGIAWPVLEQAKAAIRALQDARSELASFATHPLFARAVVAAYNAGSPHVASMLRSGNDPDAATAHGNYGADVLERRESLFRRYPDTFKR